MVEGRKAHLPRDIPWAGVWEQDALCRRPSVDPEIFYPDRGDSVTPARRVCAHCPVIEECLRYAIDINERIGVWGGSSDFQRKQIAASRNLDASIATHIAKLRRAFNVEDVA